jgi:hypothetical protein
MTTKPGVVGERVLPKGKDVCDSAVLLLSIEASEADKVDLTEF